MSKWLLLNAKCAHFQIYHGDNKSQSMRWWWYPLCTGPTHWIGSCASSPKQQSAVRHVAPLWHAIPTPSQLVFALTPWCCVLSREAANANFIVFGLARPGLVPTIYRTRREHANYYTSDGLLLKMGLWNFRSVWYYLTICPAWNCSHAIKIYFKYDEYLWGKVASISGLRGWNIWHPYTCVHRKKPEKKPNTTSSEQLQKCYRNIVDRYKIDTPKWQLHDRSLSCVGTATLVKHGGVKAVLLDQIYYHCKMMQSCNFRHSHKTE